MELFYHEMIKKLLPLENPAGVSEFQYDQNRLFSLE